MSPEPFRYRICDSPNFVLADCCSPGGRFVPASEAVRRRRFDSFRYRSNQSALVFKDQLPSSASLPISNIAGTLISCTAKYRDFIWREIAGFSTPRFDA